MSGAAIYLFIVSALASALWALPPMPSMADRYGAADVVVLAELHDTQRRKFNDISENVSLRVRVEKILKNASAQAGDESNAIPDEFHLAFLVFPETFEQHLRRPVGDGRYFLFLKRKVVVDAKGDSGAVLVLTEPRPFAFLPYDQSNLQALESLASQSGDLQ
ncbi:MAG: hypothetical protein NXI24_09585 [bacterium]|nr:hypothetical protein [bacterium]